MTRPASLNVFVQPMFSKAELNSDSNYVLISSMVRAMRATRPGYHFWVPFPDSGSDYRYEDDGFFRLPNVTRIPQRMPTRRHSASAHFDAVWYDRVFKSVAIDIIWSNLVETAAHVKFAGPSSYGDTFKPVSIAAHNYTLHPSLPYNLEAMENLVWAQVVGAACADWNVCNSDYTRQMVFDVLAERLHPDIVERVAATTSTIYLGTLEDALVPAPTGNTIPVIAYNHRLQNYKRWRTTLDVLDELHAEGVPFRLRYMNSTRENAAELHRRPYAEVVLCATRDEYLTALRGCDLNATHSAYETFCISAVESMALGQPLVAPRACTFGEITPPGYRYLFDNDAECKSMLRQLLTDPDARNHAGASCSEFVRDRFNNARWANAYADLFEGLDARLTWTPKPANADAFEQCAADHKGKPMVDFHRALRRIKIGGVGPFGDQSMPLSRASRWLRRIGYRVASKTGRQYVQEDRP